MHDSIPQCLSNGQPRPGRDGVLAAAAAHLHAGGFLADLTRRVALRTEGGDAACLDAYLDSEMAPTLQALGFTVSVRENRGGNAFLVARRVEDPALPGVLLYGHGDVAPGTEESWSAGLSPWTVTGRDGRLYGRGTADNKGQHGIALAALAAVLQARGGRLGFNVTWLMEMGEEIGSPNLRAFCRDHAAILRADVLIASDGPRVAAHRPTLFLGSRGGMTIRLSVSLRDEERHPGNWGGLIANPATMLAAAVAFIVDGRGRILVPALRPPPLGADVRRALADVEHERGPDDPEIEPNWGEPGLTPAERVYGWNALEVLALGAGNAARPANAIPGRAEAHLQLRFVVGTDVDAAAAALRAHLDGHGLHDVAVDTRIVMRPTRLALDDAWVTQAASSMAGSTGRPPAVLPNFGGSLPNDIFVEELALPTLWIPHAHPGCNQHAGDEHILASNVEEGLRIMAGLFWDLPTFSLS